MEFRISGESDSECMKDPLRHSVNGWTCHLEGTPTDMASKMMPVLHVAVQCVQDVMFAMRFMTSVGLKVELPMCQELMMKAGQCMQELDSWKPNPTC